MRILLSLSLAAVILYFAGAGVLAEAFHRAATLNAVLAQAAAAAR